MARALDTGLPDPANLTADAVAGIEDTDKHRLVAIACVQARAVTQAAASPRPSPTADLDETKAALADAEAALAEATIGAGRYQHTAIGQAVVDAQRASIEGRPTGAHRPARHVSQERRYAADELPDAVVISAAADQHLQGLVDAETARLHHVIADLQDRIGGLEHDQQRAERRWQGIAQQVKSARRDVRQLGRNLDRLRDDLDRPSHARQGQSPRYRHPVPALSREAEVRSIEPPEQAIEL